MELPQSATIYVLFVCWLLAGCSSPNPEQADHNTVLQLSDSSLNACCPYFFKGPSGEKLLIFTAEDTLKDNYVYFADWNTEKQQFNRPTKIKETRGAALNAESMSKAALKANGEMIVAFGLKKPTESNPFGGEIRYVSSSDNGATWSNPRYLHEDTVAGKGRSYFDLASLADGEVGACWLDASYPDGGRPVKFAKTSKSGGFANETLVDKLACECCRTKIIQDGHGTIHVAFRDVNVMNEDLHIRDVMVVSSNDGGASFLKTTPLSHDNWELVGCPHSGPGISNSKNKMHAAWFTAGGETGIYYTATENVENGFLSRELISKKGKNPQIQALSDDKVAIAWSEFSQPAQSSLHAGGHHNHAGHHEETPSTSFNRIMLMLKSDTGAETIQISAEGQNASFPVIQASGNELLLAWTEDVEGAQKVVYKKVAVK